MFVGLYVGNKGLEETGIPATSVKVADALRREFPEAIVLVVSRVEEAQGEQELMVLSPGRQPQACWRFSCTYRACLRALGVLELGADETPTCSPTSPPPPPHPGRLLLSPLPESPSPTLRYRQKLLHK